jgi:hypothetical protein
MRETIGHDAGQEGLEILLPINENTHHTDYGRRREEPWPTTFQATSIDLALQEI